MSGLPSMLHSDGIQKYRQTQFGGYDHTLGADNGALWDMENLTGELYPLLSPRRRRWIAANLSKPNGLYTHDGIYWVDGDGFYADGERKGTVTDCRKTFASLGAYIVILPDRAYYNRLTGEFGPMEAEWSGGAAIRDGTYAEEEAKGNTIFAEGADWASIFRVGDAVTISGCTLHPENNKTSVIREIDGDELRFYENVFTISEGGDTEQISVKRTVPELDFICENENRLWGCKGDTIYSCKLGDIFNWNVFDGVATDSYAVDVGSAGDFTGCCSYLGYPVFFKEEHIYKVYGSKPSNFQVMGSASLGIEAGSGASVAIAGETLFYLSRTGITAYTGGIPQSVAAPFGTQRFRNAVGGSDGTRYFVSMEDQDGRWHLFVYDTRRGLWHREDFSYDAGSDPLYSQYRKQYTREGQRATADALGAAAAASGGIPSSYAATAAGQAGDYYASKMTDKIPELYQLAYNQYMNEHSMKLSDLGAVQGAEQSDYQKYLNALSQYNTDRSFDYGVWSDAQQRAANDLQTAIGLEQMDYQKYLDQLGQYNTDRSFGYGQHLDEIGQQTQLRNEALNKAQLAAGYGDYSFLNDMGIKTDNDPTEWERQYNLAVLAAQYGDYSGLRALGVSPDANGLYQFNLAASGGNKATGSSGGSRSSGSGSSASGGAGQDNGIVASMLALGDDILAREYLIGLGYSNAVYSDLWDAYQDAKESGWGGYGGGSAEAAAGLPAPGQTSGSAGTGQSNTYNSLLNAIRNINPGTSANVPAVFADRIQKALSAGSLTDAEADRLLSMLGY